MSEWFDAEAHADRALEMFERGRWAEAEAELRKALALNPEQPEWHFNLGLTLEHAGRDSDALACYERASELLPDEPEPLVAAGVIANRLGHFQRAISCFEQALRLEPSLEEAYAHKIESHIRSGQHDEAETTFYLALQALPEPSAQCLAVMAESFIHRVYEQQSPWSAVAPDPETPSQADDLEQTASPESASDSTYLFSRAEWCLREAMRLAPNMPRLRARLASVFAATGKPQRALQLYLRELRDDPGNIDTLLEYGSLLQELGRYPEAADKFRRVLELEPANVDAHFRLGLIALSAHRYEQASLQFELVLKLDQNFPGIRGAMGEAMLRRDRLSEARRYLLEEFSQWRLTMEDQTTQTSRADEPGPGSHLADAQSADHQGAGSRCDRPSPLHPAHLADLLLDVDEPARAADVLETLVAIQPSIDLLRQLALARFRAGDRDGGAAISRRVLRLEPQCVRSMHNLALSAMQQNRLSVAWGWIQRGMRVNRHDEGLRRLRVRLWMAILSQSWRSVLQHAMKRTRRMLLRNSGK